jgi:glyceraldehyde 3-phosphate dehydrogenase
MCSMETVQQQTPVRIGINGFGRIGRTFTRALWARDCEVDVELVAVNDVMPAEQLAYLLEFDSVSGRLGQPAVVSDDEITVGSHAVRVLRAPTPDELPWTDLGVDIVVDGSRRFGPAKEARRHLGSGAKVVVVTGPSEGADATFVVGVNDDSFDLSRHQIVSNASCTTNCLVPMAKVLDEAFGIEDGLMTTVHAYTSDQPLVDGSVSELRQSRAAATNVVPTTTGAARATRLVVPDLDGRLAGTSLRVPVPDGSITDLTVLLRTTPSADEVNAAFREAAAGPMAGIIEYSDRPLVSSDIVGRTASCIFDAPLTITGNRLIKVFGWYDNEWGYSNRLVDLVLRVADGIRHTSAA